MAENILLYFSDTGRGHRSATEAIESALQLVAANEYPGVELNLITEPVAEKSHPVNRAFVELYNFLLRKHQNLMKYYYSMLHFIKPNERETAYRLSREYLMGSIRRNSPSVVVSMHPMTNHFIYRAMDEVGVTDRVKLVIIVTDPNKNLWRGWACPWAELIIAPNELVKEQLIEWGVEPSRIQVLGMPVNPEFLKPPRVERNEFLRHLGLSPDLPTLCINSGWAGGGNMLQAYRSLNTIQNPEFQVLFLAGHNQELYEKAKEEAANSNIPTAVLPFHDCMPDLMAAVDMMVTKAGGLTTFECVARKLPMIIDVITPPMPQEAGTVDILVDSGLGRRLEKPEQLQHLVKTLKHDPDRLSRPLPSKYSLDQTHAVFDIARAVLKRTPEVITPRSITFESSKKAN